MVSETRTYSLIDFGSTFTQVQRVLDQVTRPNTARRWNPTFSTASTERLLKSGRPPLALRM